MATTINKKRLLTRVLTNAKKASAARETQPVLEQFIYGLCREDATPEQADKAFRFLQTQFFDWNEVRVSSSRELEEAFTGMTGAEGRAQRLVAFLQEVFETEFSFDLGSLEKRGLKQAARQRMRYQASNDFVSSWVVQRSLGGHAIPLDAPTLRSVRRLGLLEDEQESLEASRATLEHLVSKNDGPKFTDSMSGIAQKYCLEEAPLCRTCPLSADCQMAQDGSAEPQTAGATARRSKPR